MSRDGWRERTRFVVIHWSTALFEDMPAPRLCHKLKRSYELAFFVNNIVRAPYRYMSETKE